jgi:hypothetical protein
LLATKGGHFPFRVAQLRDARATNGKLSLSGDGPAVDHGGMTHSAGNADPGSKVQNSYSFLVTVCPPAPLAESETAKKVARQESTRNSYSKASYEPFRGAPLTR